MMRKLNGFRQSFRQNRISQIILYIMAVLVTIQNFELIIGLIRYPTVKTCLMLMVTAAITMMLYFLTGGIKMFGTLFKVASGISAIFAGICSSLLGWILFLGPVFSVVLPLAAKIFIIGVSAIFAFAFPGVFVPAFRASAEMLSRKKPDR